VILNEEAVKTLLHSPFKMETGY